MKKEYLKPEMAEILVQTCGVLAGSDPDTVTSEKGGDANSGFGKASSFFDDGSDNSDW